MAGGTMQLVANSSLTGVTLTATSGNPSVLVGTQTIPVSSLSVGANSVQITPGSSILTALQSGATINHSLSCSYADGKSVVSTAGTPYPPPPLLPYATFSTSFVNINKYNSDPPFALETPVSNNNTAFSFTSSNTAVASINPPTIINALKFNGTTNFVDFGANIVELGKSSFTIECWVKTSGTSMGILNCQNSSNSTWEIGEKSLYIDANGIPVFVGFQCNFIYASVAVNDNLWHHIAVTWLYTGGTSGTPTFYVDGINQTGTTHPFYSQYPQYTANTFNVGTFVFGKPTNQESVNFFNGSVCELRIWSIARSANEIFQNYRRMLAGNETGLVAYNRFNQGIAGGTNTGITNVTNNKTTGGYTGTLSGSFVLTGTSSNFVSGISIRESTDVNVNGVGTTTITATHEASSIYASTSVSATLMVISPLVSLYPFNSNGNDASTNNNNLTNVNNVTFNTSGRNQGDGAASFSGNNYFEIANDGRFSPDNFSITFWIKPMIDTQNYQSIATCRKTDGTAGWMIYITPSNNLEFWTGNGSSSSWSGYDQNLFSNFGSLNTWVHVAFTFTKASGLLVVYINGGGLGVAGVLRSYVNNTSTSLRIGAGGDAATYFLRSGTLLDDFRIYNKVLTETEVSRVFQGYL